MWTRNGPAWWSNAQLIVGRYKMMLSWWWRTESRLKEQHCWTLLIIPSVRSNNSTPLINRKNVLIQWRRQRDRRRVQWGRYRQARWRPAWCSRRRHTQTGSAGDYLREYIIIIFNALQQRFWKKIYNSVIKILVDTHFTNTTTRWNSFIWKL